jgi:hypothetical protein
MSTRFEARRLGTVTVGQHGQAITEFVVVCLLMVPLFLAVVYVGKYSDVKQTAIEASRYAVWERAVDPTSAHKSDAQIQQELEVRIVGNGGRNDGKLQSTDAAASTSTDDTAYNPLWFDQGHKRMLNKLTDATVVGGIQDTAAPSSGTTAKLANAVNGVEAKWLKLDTAGWLRADVNIPLLNVNFAPLSDINFAAGSTTVLYGDAWNAGGSASVIATTKRAAPADMLLNSGPFNTVMSGIRTFVGLVEPSFRNFYPGCIAPDVVPTDRLPGYSSYATCTD